MRLTLLFDLDDTLLGSNLEEFIPRYTQSLAQKLAKSVEPKRMIEALMNATRAMAANDRPDRTLKFVFDEHFFTALNIQREEVQGEIDEFYEQDYPKLQNLTISYPQAAEVVAGAIDRGYEIAIATNPLFPKTAVLQRLAWAGIDPERYPVQVIGNYESFSFAKPKMEFYIEILGQMGWPDGPVVMVGDDEAMDIAPARELGFATFHLQTEPMQHENDNSERHVQGRLEDVLDWLDETPSEVLQPQPSGHAGLLANLRAFPAILNELTGRLDGRDWKTKPALNEWSLTEIACHLRDAECEVNIPRVQRVLAKNNPFIAGRNTDVWAEERDYAHQDGPQALRDFVKYRIELANLLAGIGEDAWKLPARHAIFGPMLLHELVGITISHDRLHLKTIHQLTQPVT
jgi:FMN phosphatase YigB (HAD superfamily)